MTSTIGWFIAGFLVAAVGYISARWLILPWWRERGRPKMPGGEDKFIFSEPVDAEIHRAVERGWYLAKHDPLMRGQAGNLQPNVFLFVPHPNELLEEIANTKQEAYRCKESPSGWCGGYFGWRARPPEIHFTIGKRTERVVRHESLHAMAWLLRWKDWRTFDGH